MGRDSGWLTCASKVASYYGQGPDLIYIPEGCFDTNQFLKDVESLYLKKNKVLVAVSEGIRDINGHYLLQSHINNNADHFGHIQLGGIGSVLAEIVNKELIRSRLVFDGIHYHSTSGHIYHNDLKAAKKLVKSNHI